MNNRHKYPPEWFDTIRPAILKRDKYTCQHCQRKHRHFYDITKGRPGILIDSADVTFIKAKGYKVEQVHLQVAHLDQDTTNNNETNLRCLCASCHLKFDNKYRLVLRNAKSPLSTQIDARKLPKDTPLGYWHYLASPKSQNSKLDPESPENA